MINQKKKSKRNQKEKEKEKEKINKDSNEIKFSNNIRETIIDNLDKLSSKQNIKNIVEFKSLDINTKNIKDILETKDFEINSFEFEDALKLDKRSYFQYYVSLLKYNHPLMFSFCSYNDYNSRIIKIFLFFFSFSSDLTINALFFNDDTMHKIYQDKGKYDLLFQIPQILYSTLISKLIDALIKNLALSQDNIVELKKEKEKNNLEKKSDKVLKNISNQNYSIFCNSFFYFIIFLVLYIMFLLYIC